MRVVESIKTKYIRIYTKFAPSKNNNNTFGVVVFFTGVFPLSIDLAGLLVILEGLTRFRGSGGLSILSLGVSTVSPIKETYDVKIWFYLYVV